MSSRMRRTGFRFLRNKQYSSQDLSECPAFFQDGLRRPTSIGVQPGKQILFDSVLRGYPIGSFLFWQVSTQNSKQYEFYEFIRDYHDLKQRHNQKAEFI